jgi:hypothetical protein
MTADGAMLRDGQSHDTAIGLSVTAAIGGVAIVVVAPMVSETWRKPRKR